MTKYDAISPPLILKGEDWVVDRKSIYWPGRWLASWGVYCEEFACNDDVEKEFIIPKNSIIRICASKQFVKGAVHRVFRGPDLYTEAEKLLAKKGFKMLRPYYWWVEIKGPNVNA